MSVYGVSDRRDAVPARLTVRLIDFAGNVLTKWEQPIQLAGNASRAYMLPPAPTGATWNFTDVTPPAGVCTVTVISSGSVT